MPDLLIELFSEEIPARMQAQAATDLRRMVTDGLVEAGLTYGGAQAMVTPRRLALAVEGLTADSKPVREERKGPRTDAPAAALEGFLRSTGLTKEQLEIRDDKKAQVYFAVVEKPGRAAPAIIAEVLEATVRSFPWPKSMRWGSGALRWVRPLHSIICLLSTPEGSEVVPVDVDGIKAGATTEGHRFMSAGRFAVTNFDDYAAKLAKAFVVLDPGERMARIKHDAETLAFAQGLELVPDDKLLAEVAGLVEWPVALMGKIPEQFLDLPPEVLQTSMREHQKFFSVKNPRTGRIEGFVTVANRETADNGATVIAGNLKVLTARLSDAKFFWEKDLRVAKAGMVDWLDGLKSVTFHNKLGSQADRIARIESLAREIAPMVGADPEQAALAARVAKADLRSSMVGEFPELQGIMGRYYALVAGLPPAIADAARDHWQPMRQSDPVPTEPVAVTVALAEKAETLCDFWVYQEFPTGSKDPFALRRACIGMSELVLRNGVRLPLATLFSSYVQGYDWSASDRAELDEHEKQLTTLQWRLDPSNQQVGLNAFLSQPTEKELDEVRHEITATKNKIAEREAWLLELPSNLVTFFHDRLKVFLREDGIRHDVIDACLAMPGNDDLTLLVNRARALQAFLDSDDGTNLLQGCKRANNILTQAEAKDGVEYSYGADVKFAEGPEEKALFAALDAAEAKIGPAMKSEDFAAAMSAMAALRTPLDAFFEAVQVNSDNQILRRNRLNLLSRIRQTCLSVADLTKVEG
jgi:glycyl-tRNA synthetase beta chain